MIRRRSLSTKIFLLGALNILIVGALFLAFLHLHLRLTFDFNSFLLAPARERIVSMSRQIALDLTDLPRARWSGLLNAYTSRYPAHFYLFSEDGIELAGEAVTLPADFSRQIERRLRFHHGPPPPDGAPPFHPPGPPQDDPAFHPSEPPVQDRSFGRHAQTTNPPIAFLHTARPTGYWAGVSIPIWTYGAGDAVHAVVVWRFTSLWWEPFYFDVRPWLLLLTVALLIPAICWIPFVRSMTRAIGRMTTATGQIADGHFDIKLDVDRGDELGNLSESINRMASRLGGYVNGQKRFLGDIAHELSSPIARMQMAIGILEQRVTGATSSYVEDVREELEHMGSLVNEVLQFSRLGATRKPVRVEALDLKSLAGRVIERESTLDTVVESSIPAGLFVQADADCLFRALANVLRNAIRYAGHAGAITISAQSGEDRVKITVSDNGPGIPTTELENVFRPFYRPEFARKRETGGTGLGLAIVRDCVESSGGHVECRNRLPHGLDVVLEFPAAVAESAPITPNLA